MSIYSLSFNEVVKILGLTSQSEIDKLKTKIQADKKKLIYYFSILRDKYQDIDFFRYKAYVEVINKISQNNFPLSPKIVTKHKIAGDKITKKIIEILETGGLEEVDNSNINKEVSTSNENIADDIINALPRKIFYDIKHKSKVSQKRKHFVVLAYTTKDIEFISKFVVNYFIKNKLDQNVKYFNFQNHRILKIVLEDFSLIEILFPFEKTKEITEKYFFDDNFEDFVKSARLNNKYYSFFALAKNPFQIV